MGKSVLVLEDEAIVAMDLAAELEDAGWRVIGPAGSIAEADRLIEVEMPDTAVLDVNLSGAQSFDLAARLRARGCPVLFLTGYAEGSLPDHLSDTPIVSKPVDPSLLTRQLASLSAPT
ncbi:response regulator [Thalassococcus sp. BH17M4-6]|uniref:response regulator n=1 Tax=Thalassococcus sp. BH17M4-6 TaxID=3413148 RepID=UPI003BEC155D